MEESMTTHNHTHKKKLEEPDSTFKGLENSKTLRLKPFFPPGEKYISIKIQFLHNEAPESQHFTEKFPRVPVLFFD